MTSVITRLFSKIKINNCWIWTGKLNYDGYGSIKVDKKMKKVHRISYEYFKEIIPEGLEIDHLCKNRACCNPNHLETVTHIENLKRQRKIRNSNESWCSKCKGFLPKENFSKNKSTWRGLANQCKICENKRNKEYYRRKNTR